MIAESRLGVFLFLTCLIPTAVGGEGQTASYLRDSEESKYRGHVRRIEIDLYSPKESTPWISVRFLHEQGSFGFTAAGEKAFSLLTPQRHLNLDRYVLCTSNGRRLEFQRRETARPFLPFSFDLQPEYVLPVCLDGNNGFLPDTVFMGDRFTFEKMSPIEEPPEIPAATVIVLSDDLLVGTSRNSREVDGKRIPWEQLYGDMNLDYEYRPFDENDVSRMLAAGFNYFDRVLPEQFDYLIDEPVFFDLDGFWGYQRPVFPEVFYHPGFLGVEDFLDEPAYIFWEDAHYEDFSGINPAKTPAQMAKRQEERTQSEYDRATRGRMPGLMEKLSWAGVVLENVQLVEPEFPIWEEFYSTACYQLRIPTSGFVHEGRYCHPQAVDLLNNTFRVGLPRKPRTTFLFYFSFLRGAARVFDKDWGTSIYGQSDPEISPLAVKMAYDRGARYIFFWTSDRGHHLPFEEQLALAEELSAHARENPRRDRRKLIRSAEDAIVLPYGFTFSISDYQKQRMEDLWQRSSFPLEGGRLPDGTPYYSVLRCAASKMEELIKEGKEFDVVVDVPELAEAGYARLHRVLPEARRRAYEYPWWIHYKLQILLVALVAFLIVYRSYRIVRWMSNSSSRNRH